MGNTVPDAVRQQNIIYLQYFVAISLFLLHGYYNFIQLNAAHVANITGVVFITTRLNWDCSVLTTHNNGISGNANAFDIMNNGFSLFSLMTIAFFIRLCSLGPGTGELQFLTYIFVVSMELYLAREIERNVWW
ncbi:hypothetical protein J3F84DRAFT_394549 [Trichoderma pleuroticola]